ncbi:MAG: hypothetical protein E7389_08530 [Ruminococcaceae bacterium]|nr:hypothetical protein [Oscillospiraceae bacterium]
MDNLTAIIAREIKKQYRSVRRFAISLGIPQTTVASTLKNGISGTAYSTVVKMCEALDIKLVNYDTPLLADDRRVKILEMLDSLDEVGLHTVETVIYVEHDRCTGNKLKVGDVVPYGGESFKAKADARAKKAAAESLRNNKKNKK